MVGAGILAGIVFSMVLGHWYLNVSRLPVTLLKKATLTVVAILVPYTYGLSLLVLGLVDLLLYRRVADLIVCYRCGSLYRGFKVDRVVIEPFDHFRRFKIHQEQ